MQFPWILCTTITRKHVMSLLKFRCQFVQIIAKPIYSFRFHYCLLVFAGHWTPLISTDRSAIWFLLRHSLHFRRNNRYFHQLYYFRQQFIVKKIFQLWISSLAHVLHMSSYHWLGGFKLKSATVRESVLIINISGNRRWLLTTLFVIKTFTLARYKQNLDPNKNMRIKFGMLGACMSFQTQIVNN